MGLLVVGFASAQSKDPYEGRVGINIMTPSATLNIKSLTGTDATTKNFELENASGTKMVTVLDNGSLGINNANPFYTLDVNGNGRFINGNGDTQVNIGAVAGQFAYNRFLRGIKARWDIGMTNALESTGDKGSNFYINSFNDEGVYKATPFFISRENSRIGINTVGPTSTLDIAGNARIRTIPQGTDETIFTKVLVADASGNIAAISRTDPGVPNATETIYGNSKVPTKIMADGETFYTIQENRQEKGGAYYRYTGQSITLPPGKWVVHCAYLVSGANDTLDREHQLEDGKSVWFRGIIDDNDTNGIVNNLGHLNVPKTPILISTSLNQADLYKVALGVWLIDNDTNTDKTYYVKVSIHPNGKFVSSDMDKVSQFSVWLEDYLFAMKRK